ncbi:MAG: FAD-linked oxidase [Cytophaga sp.]|nr:FAD-linked oxidase [Cytophaga sp.]
MASGKISNWGNYPVIEANMKDFGDQKELLSNIQSTPSFAVRGSGLSYGDASLAKNILSTLRYNRVLQFDEKNGLLTTEAGITLDEILKVIVPKGWFLPVTPGTKFITVGGAVAGDVHGKNHHKESSFCKYVTQLEVILADGSLVVCNTNTNTTLFRTICGGVGMAGFILTVQFQLKPIETSYIHQKNIIVRNLDEMLDKLQQFDASTYSVSWIDCLAGGNKLGRGVLMLGEHAVREEVNSRDYLRVHNDPKISIPVFFPSFALNTVSISAFNFLYYHKHRMAAKDFIVHYDTFFYPLDFIRHWNKMYGKRGFLQYQFVIPFEDAAKGLRIIIDAISKSGAASFLAVLKILGEGENMLSFPMPGFTLALDFPISDKIFPFLDKMDKIVGDLGGRIYLVKDARMTAETYRKGYANAVAFKEQVNKFDPTHKFTSALSERLEMI